MDSALPIAGALAFVCGSIPFAIAIPLLMGLPDPRTYGSGNPGATNVMRAGSKLAGRLVFALDFVKGVIPVGAALLLASQAAASVAAACAVAGHVWSPFLKFRGGKGVATGLGGLLAMDWRLFAIAGGLIALCYVLFRVVSIACVLGLVAAAAYAVLALEPYSPQGAAAATIAFIVVMRHKDNFRRMAAGKELHFKRKAAEPPEKTEQEPPDKEDSARS